MNSNGGKPEPVDPENAARMIEIELMRQRAARQVAGSPYRGLRAASFIFLFAIILSALLALYYLVSSGRLDELRARNAPKPSPSLAPPSSSTP
jgi:hypothetical protein